MPAVIECEPGIYSPGTGGRAHRNAEVWVKVDDQDETKVVESGKGTLLLMVVPGKTYVYTLKDRGTVLATVTVKFHR